MGVMKMSRLEGEPMRMRYKVGIALAIAGLGIGTIVAVYKLDEQARGDKKECVDMGQIDERGQKLENFVSGQGCERFLKTNRRIYIPQRTGAW